ncbi:MAG: flagellar hook-associated protein FlgK [Rhodobacteraceae bacterium]|nr:flagellar hook-associated protein FlgK [Paracoccaceae bacterium]
MSLNGAMSNALGGLAVASRSAALVSSNISNALTPGYGQRTLSVSSSSRSDMGGVQINGVVRRSNPALIADRRGADAAAEGAGAMVAFAKEMERVFGDAVTGDTLSSAISNFDGALIMAAADPSSQTRLAALSASAHAMTQKFNDMSDGIQSARLQADTAIAQDVTTLNAGLQNIDRLNKQIVKAQVLGQDTSSLEDQRHNQIDQISGIVPLQVIARDRGEVALFTMGGAALLDGAPSEVQFTAAQAIDAGSTLNGGSLSGLAMNGIAHTARDGGAFAGGTLMANFAIRDQDAPALQQTLDAIALDLSDRFGSNGPDATLGATDPGIFTDGGSLVNAVDEVGLSSRLSLNSDLEPGASTLWKWRDGLGANLPGAPGDGSLIGSLKKALHSSIPGASTSLPPGNHRLSDLSDGLLSDAAALRLGAEASQGVSETRRAALVELELAEGVDTDAELQTLILIEQSYAANARVITTVDEMLQRILAI